MSTPLRFKLGKKEAVPGAIQFSFTNYFEKEALPKPPKVFGSWQHFWNLGMYKNDRVGCCTIAGSANETAIWHHDARSWVKFRDEDILSDYTALSGYDPDAPLVVDKNHPHGTNPTDTGVSMSEVASYRRKTGIVDHNGKRHRVDAYMQLPTGDFGSLKIAMYLFGAVAIGIRVPDYFQEEFDDETPWSVRTSDYKIMGGHYIPGVGIDDKGNIVVITWGRYQKMTRECYEKFSDEACGFLSVERLINKLSPEGFNDEALLSDLRQLKDTSGWGSEDNWFQKWFRGDFSLTKLR